MDIKPAVLYSVSVTHRPRIADCRLQTADCYPGVTKGTARDDCVLSCQVALSFTFTSMCKKTHLPSHLNPFSVSSTSPPLFPFFYLLLFFPSPLPTYLIHSIFILFFFSLLSVLPSLSLCVFYFEYKITFRLKKTLKK